MKSKQNSKSEKIEYRYTLNQKKQKLNNYSQLLFPNESEIKVNNIRDLCIKFPHLKSF